jgi:hypothetical protein
MPPPPSPPSPSCPLSVLCVVGGSGIGSNQCCSVGWCNWRRRAEEAKEEEEEEKGLSKGRRVFVQVKVEEEVVALFRLLWRSQVSGEAEERETRRRK